MSAEPASTPTVGRRRRTASVALQVVGVVGFAVCVILAVLVLLGRGWAVDQVDSVSTSLNAALDKGMPVLEAATEKVATVSDQVQKLSDLSATLAATDTPAPGAAQSLSARLSVVSQRYGELRAGYADARSSIVSALDRLEALSRFAPGISVPQGPIDALARLDEAIRGVDAQIATLVGDGDTTLVQATAQRVSTASTQLLATLGQVSTRLDDAETRLTEAGAKVDTTMSSITTGITVLALLIVLALVYVAALHVVLLRSAGGLRRPRAA
jgi:hypothetical protein